MNRRNKLAAVAVAGVMLFLTMLALGCVRAADCTAEAKQLENEPEADPFQDFRNERKSVRQIQISQLNGMIHSGADDNETVVLAQKRLLELMDCMEKETTLEGILKIRSFEDVIVAIYGESVSVFVKTDVLTQQQTAVILDLVCEEAEFLSGNVKIIPIN